jgi:cytochrome c-type biogenesis protein
VIGVIAGVVQHALQSWWAPALAFAAGTVSCASPCVLPLLPGYVAFVAGGQAPERGRQTMTPILLFILGFTVVFTFVFGFAAGSVSRWLRLPVGQRLAGSFVFGFGLFMLLYAVGARVPWLYREERPLLSRIQPGKAGAFPLGMAFAIGWTPCIGPVLGAILTLAAAQGGTLRALLLLFLYSLGLGLPILLLGAGMRWVMGASRFISRNYHWIAGAGGAAMMTIGVLLISGLWVRLLVPLLRLVNRFTPAI